MNDYKKYPRTLHLPWSPGNTSDDKILTSTDHFVGKEVIVTIKFDGECTSLYNDFIHARSTGANPHPTQSWIKQLHSSIANQIPLGWRICGENLYGKHAIHYHNLPTYFMVFSIWDDKNNALPWDDTIIYSELLGLQTVPVIYRGMWDEDLIKNLYTPTYDGDECEGYVVRLADSFNYAQFEWSLAKYVRAGHVPEHARHWRTGKIIPNELREGT